MKALALVIPSRFFMYRMFTSSSVIASTSFGLLPFPSYYSCLLRDSEVFRVCSNSRSSILLFGYLQTFKWRLKLERNPLRLEGSNSPPSLLLTVIINSLKKSPSCSGIISSTFLSALFFFFQKRHENGNVSLRFGSVFLFSCSWISSFTGFSGAGNRKLEVSAISNS